MQQKLIGFENIFNPQPLLIEPLDIQALIDACDMHKRITNVQVVDIGSKENYGF
jgi:hypothetical protein